MKPLGTVEGALLRKKKLRERTRAAMKVKRGRQERISGHTPYEWDFRPSGKLVENRKEQKTITWIQQLHAGGTSLRKIAERLNDRGVRPKRAKKWLHSSVLRIVWRTT